MLAVAACLGAALAAPAAAAANGTIEGSVDSAATGLPLVEMPVCASSIPFGFEECAETNFLGHYALSVPAGTYTVEFNPYSLGGYQPQWFFNSPTAAAATPITVNEGGTTGPVNGALFSRYGAISGTVTSASGGGPASGIRVCASPTSTTEFEFSYECSSTDEAGHYEIGFLEPGSYRVHFEAMFKYNEGTEGFELATGNYVSQYYLGQSQSASATPVGVNAGQTTGSVDVALQPGATISGNVSDAVTNGALQGISVCAWGTGEYACEETDKNGNYSLPTLAAGSYKVEFAPSRFYDRAAEKAGHFGTTRGEFPLIDYATQYWNDKLSFEAAEAVNATAGATASGINAKMVKQVQPPPPAPTPGTAVVGPKAKVKGGKASLSVKCEGAGACSGSLQLSAKVVTTKKVAKGKPKKKVHTAVIGKASFSIAAGKTSTVAVTLNGAGKDLVGQAGSKGVQASVSGSGVKAGSVTLVGQSKPKKKKPGKPAKHQKH
jgi:hypothetical protein